MSFNKITQLFDLFKQEPGLVMPPVQLYATLFPLSDASYNTGLFKNLHGRPITYLNQLVDKCVQSAEKNGLTVVEDFKHNVGNIPLDAPQVASLMASALGEFSLRYGNRHQEKIQAWVRESFDDLLPRLTPAHRARGVEYFMQTMAQDEHYQKTAGFRSIVEKQAKGLGSEDLVTASDFLIQRIKHLRKNVDLQLKAENDLAR